LAAGQQKRERSAEAIGQRMDFCGSSAARAADGLREFPPLWNGPPRSSIVNGWTTGGVT
jgi:hypothetical protein